MIEQECSSVFNLNQDKEGNKYTLLLANETLTEVKKFSRRYFISESKFVEVVLKFRFEEIQSDIEVDEYHYIEDYLEVAEARSGNCYDNRKIDNETKEFTVILPSSLIIAIDTFCNLIHWKQERFIEDALEFWVKELNIRLKMMELEFLNAFFDFKPVLKVIEDALKEGY